jgi:MerR family transcriptional regulator, thiopeptide resistance regulator
MKPARTYGIAAFAALAGVTPRALRHYDRLGLLKPRRSTAGYRQYAERDLETLEEIVALKFIGVPLKQIGAMRRRPEQPFATVLRAQREALEARRRTLTRAVEAIATAEALLRSGAAIDADAIRPIIEVMHMEQNHEQLIKTYGVMLKAKVSHLAALSADERKALKAQWSALVAEVRAALGEDPAGPKAQDLLDRWLSLQRATIGGDETIAMAPGLAPLPDNPTPELRSALWARRSEWLPPDAAEKAADVPNANDALATSRTLASSLIGDDVFEFIGKAKAARG